MIATVHYLLRSLRVVTIFVAVTVIDRAITGLLQKHRKTFYTVATTSQNITIPNLTEIDSHNVNRVTIQIRKLSPKKTAVAKYMSNTCQKQKNEMHQQQIKMNEENKLN